MKIVLNEKEYAEECLKNNDIGNSPYFTLSILAKYYYHHYGYRKKKITDLLISFLQKNYSKYDCNISKWNDTVEKIAANAGKYKLFQIDGVWITKTELVTIESLSNKMLERLAFTLLCLAKMGNIKNPLNNGWVNLEAKEVFKLARISCCVKERYDLLGQLRDIGLLEYPKRNDNLSCRITYINDESEQKIFVSDFRELGYEYLRYKGGRFIFCGECGILIRNNKNQTRKYCSHCSCYVPKGEKAVQCIECGKVFWVSARVSNKRRCNRCQGERNKDKKRQWSQANKRCDKSIDEN